MTHRPARSPDVAGHHHHGHAAGRNERGVFWAAVLTGGFMVAEVVGGLVSGSLALIADAAHMLTDSLALGLAWFAFRLARRPADQSRTYGFDRLQVIVAFANGLALVFIVTWILIEAVARLNAPVAVEGGLMLGVAAAGLAVNIAAFAILHRADRDNLNIRGAILHVLGDLLGSVAALTAALVILTTGWTPIDPLLSILVGLILLRSAWRLIAEAGHILLEGAPPSIDVAAIGRDIEAHVTGVTGVHHVHVWSLTQEKPLITLHAQIVDGTDADHALDRINRRLADAFGITHSTVQIERRRCDHNPLGSAPVVD